MIENLPPYVLPALTFVLGFIIANLLRSGKTKTLKTDLESAESRVYEVQDASKKKLSEKNEIIAQLQKKQKQLIPSPNTRPADNKELKELKAKNATLEIDLKNLNAKLKEFKVETAVKKVDKRYPIKKYRSTLIAEQKPKEETKKILSSIMKEETKTKDVSEKPSKDKPKVKSTKSKPSKSKKAKIVASKSKKKKKKVKSKKQKSKKSLDLVKEEKAKLSKKKSKKKKKRKSK